VGLKIRLDRIMGFYGFRKLERYQTCKGK